MSAGFNTTGLNVRNNQTIFANSSSLDLNVTDALNFHAVTEVYNDNLNYNI
jgi:hypothetical protein